MTYLEIKEKIEKAISDNDVDSLLELFTIENAITLRDYNTGLSQRVIYYQVLRNSFDELKKVTDEDFEIIFNTGLSVEEKNKRLSELGLTVDQPKTVKKWQAFN